MIIAERDCSRIAPFPRTISSRSRTEPIEQVNSGAPVVLARVRDEDPVVDERLQIRPGTTSGTTLLIRAATGCHWVPVSLYNSVYGAKSWAARPSRWRRRSMDNK